MTCALCNRPVNSSYVALRGQKFHANCATRAVNNYNTPIPDKEHELPDDYFARIEEEMEQDDFFEDEIVDDEILNQIPPIKKENGHGKLMVHAGAHYVTRSELSGLQLPEETDTFKPIAHDALINAIEESLSYRHLSITREEFAVSKDGMKLFGLLEIGDSVNGFTFGIGLRNSNDKSMRLAMVAGGRVTVCDNMLLSGEFKPMLAKHSKNLDLIESVSIAVDRIQRNFNPMLGNITIMKSIQLMDHKAKEFIYDSFLDQNMPISLIREVHQNYFDSPIREFRDFNVWALLNAYTSAFKRLNPVSQYENTARIGRIISENFIPS